MAAEILHNPIRDRQTKAQTLADRLRRDEWIEDAINQFARDSRAIVGDADTDQVTGRSCGDVNRGLLYVSDGIECIADQIDQHLLELHRVSIDPQVRFYVLAGSHSRRFYLTADQEERALNSTLDRDRFRAA